MEAMVEKWVVVMAQKYLVAQVEGEVEREKTIRLQLGLWRQLRDVALKACVVRMVVWSRVAKEEVLAVALMVLEEVEVAIWLLELQVLRAPPHMREQPA